MHPSMAEPKGTIVFTTVGRSYYGFDVFSVKLASSTTNYSASELSEHRLTDGTSVNHNASFVDDQETVAFVSERTGSPRIYLNRTGSDKPDQLPTISESFFHDRPIVKDKKLYFVSAHEPADRPFKSMSAVYSNDLELKKTARLSPVGTVDYSPAVSESGNSVAVASYGNGSWNGEFIELETDIVVFKSDDPTQRKLVCKHGGWPTWSGDSTLFFHRLAEDGWWSVFRVDLPDNIHCNNGILPKRVTPPGVHAFTPAASHNSSRIAVATRRKESDYRHIEIFDLESESFHKVTELTNPSFHHYNPFFSPNSEFLGYHRFRGESTQGDSVAPYLDPIPSPVKELKMIRFFGSFPSFSADGRYIAFNHDFGPNAGLEIVKSDGSKRWTIIKGQTSFYTSWNKAEKGVIYTSLGGVFQSSKSTVQIARVTFDPNHLDDLTVQIPHEVKILTKEESGNNAFPACSPDGKHVVFRSGRSGHKNLYIADAVNGELNGEIRQLTEGPWIDTMPNWSPDGQLIAFSSNRHKPDDTEVFSIYMIRPDGSDLRRVYVAGPEGSDVVDKERFNHVCFSPDSKWLVFTGNLGGLVAESISMPNQFQPYGDLYIVKLDGSGLQRLTLSAYENGTPTWQGSSDDVDIGSLSLNNVGGDKLRGQINEPYWLTCDI